MNTELIRRWNAKVGKEDKVLYLGDFAFGKPEPFIEQLNGDIVFIKGSHDSEIKTPLRSCVIHYGGIDFWCEHEPVVKFKYNLCAHVHEKWRIKKTGRGTMLNVGVDQWDFYPIDVETIMRVLVKGDLRKIKDVFG